jgi:hypothetical protein
MFAGSARMAVNRLAGKPVSYPELGMAVETVRVAVERHTVP